MMKIGVVSDTHSLDLPGQLLEGLEGMDHIIHAGDFCSARDLKRFESIAPVTAVRGNRDEADLCGRLPEKRIVELDGCRIGITHGSGPRHLVFEGVRAMFKKESPQAVIFGHTHEAFCETIDDVLYLNPGSPNDHITARFLSYGLLIVRQGAVQAKIIKIKD